MSYFRKHVVHSYKVIHMGLVSNLESTHPFKPEEGTTVYDHGGLNKVVLIPAEYTLYYVRATTPHSLMEHTINEGGERVKWYVDFDFERPTTFVITEPHSPDRTYNVNALYYKLLKSNTKPDELVLSLQDDVESLVLHFRVELI